MDGSIQACILHLYLYPYALMKKISQSLQLCTSYKQLLGLHLQVNKTAKRSCQLAALLHDLGALVFVFTVHWPP